MGNGWHIFKELDYNFCSIVSVICTCCFCVKTKKEIVLKYEIWDDHSGNLIYILQYSGGNHKK